MPTAKERYQQALSLANDKKYQPALKLLKTIDHAKARELEAQIKARMPAAPGYRKYTKWILFVLVIVLAFVGLQWFNQTKYMVDESNIRFHLKEACEFQAIINRTDDALCSAWVDDVMANYQQTAMGCLSESNPQICLETERDLPPFPGG